jgi:hypothetical protein
MMMQIPWPLRRVKLMVLQGHPCQHTRPPFISLSEDPLVETPNKRCPLARLWQNSRPCRVKSRLDSTSSRKDIPGRAGQTSEAKPVYRDVRGRYTRDNVLSVFISREWRMMKGCPSAIFMSLTTECIHPAVPRLTVPFVLQILYPQCCLYIAIRICFVILQEHGAVVPK